MDQLIYGLIEMIKSKEIRKIEKIVEPYLKRNCWESLGRLGIADKDSRRTEPAATGIDGKRGESTGKKGFPAVTGSDGNRSENRSDVGRSSDVGGSSDVCRPSEVVGRLAAAG